MIGPWGGISLFPANNVKEIIPGELIDYGNLHEFIGSLLEKGASMKDPKVVALEGKIYVFEGHIPKLPNIRMPERPKE